MTAGSVFYPIWLALIISTFYVSHCSQQPVKMASTQLCGFCGELITTLCNNPSCDFGDGPGSYPSYTWTMRTSPYDTATNCDLCKLLTHVDSTLHFLHGLEFPTSIEVRFSRTYPGGQQGPITEFRLFNIDRGQAGFSIWVDEGALGVSSDALTWV